MTKLWVVSHLPLHESEPLISGFFNLVHVRNRGMAFGIMNRPGPDWSFTLLLGATLAAIGLLLFWFYSLKPKDRGLVLPLSLILGGAVGNLLDRIHTGEVIDFLDFYIGPYHWPAFNVADSAITVGTLWLAVKILFHSTPKEKKA